jgi:hypothetical protein
MRAVFSSDRVAAVSSRRRMTTRHSRDAPNIAGLKS